MGDHSFPAKVRIKSRLDFDRVFREGVVVADDRLVLHVTLRTNRGDCGIEFSEVPGSGDLHTADSGHARSVSPLNQIARLGLSIPKRVGNAPCRNRWKRLIREVFRKHRGGFPPIDIVARPKKGAVASYAAIRVSLPALVARAVRKLSTH